MNRDERLKVRRQKQNARADERQKVIDEALKIIAKHSAREYGNMGEVVNLHIYDAQEMLDEIEALKGGDKE